MQGREYQSYRWNGYLHVPCDSVRIAGGPFLPASLNSVHEHLKLPSKMTLGVQDQYKSGCRLDRPKLRAGELHGDSMLGIARHGDYVVTQRLRTDSPPDGQIVVIERQGDEEGFGSCALKKLKITRGMTSRVNEFGELIDWESEVVSLRSHNPEHGPWTLDPSGQYRIHGVPADVRLVESETILNAVYGLEDGDTERVRTPRRR